MCPCVVMLVNSEVVIQKAFEQYVCADSLQPIQRYEFFLSMIHSCYFFLALKQKELQIAALNRYFMFLTRGLKKLWNFTVI